MVADKYNLRAVILATQISSMVLALLLALLTLNGWVRVWEIMALALLSGVINAFDLPARQTFLIDLVRRDDLMNAIALNSAVFNGSRIIGPFVHGVRPYLFVEKLGLDVLRQLGLSLQDAEYRPDVYVRIPDNSEAVFRAAAHKDGVAIADVFQVWLDVSNHLSRGKEQAEHIRNLALKRLFGQEPS
jgi:hypothetical protein